MRCFATGFAGSLSVVFVATAVIAIDDRELQQLRNAIYESRERVGGHERQERELFERLEESDRLSEALSAAVGTARDDAAQAREASLRLDEQRSLASRQLEVTRRSLSRRAVALYKAGEVGPLRFVFGSSTIPELMTRVSALRTFVEFDADLVERYRIGRDQFARLQAEAKTAADVHAAAAERLDVRSRELRAMVGSNSLPTSSSASL